MDQLYQLSNLLALTQPSHPGQSPFLTHKTQSPPFDHHHSSSFGSSPWFHGQVQSFLFTCDGLSAGFYSDYNDCRYFHLCHQANPRFINPLNQLAITTYVCPESTYFNQRRLACTRLDEFETPCAEQVQLFRTGSSKIASPRKSDTHTDKTIEEQRLAEKKIEEQRRLVDILISLINFDKQNNINESIYNSLMDIKNANQKLIDEYSSKLANDSQETNGAATSSTISSVVVSNLKNIANSENVTQSPSVDSMLAKERAGADKKDEKVESSDLIEITFSCEGRFNCFWIVSLSSVPSLMRRL